MKCCLCKRDAVAKHMGFGWMCPWHYNKLIRGLRIERKLEKIKSIQVNLVSQEKK